MKKGNFKTLPAKKFGTRDQVWKMDKATKGLNCGQITFSSAKVLQE